MRSELGYWVVGWSSSPSSFDVAGFVVASSASSSFAPFQALPIACSSDCEHKHTAQGHSGRSTGIVPAILAFPSFFFNRCNRRLPLLGGNGNGGGSSRWCDPSRRNRLFQRRNMEWRNREWRVQRFHRWCDRLFIKEILYIRSL